MEKHNIWILNIFLFKQYVSKRNFKITVNYMCFTWLPSWHSSKKKSTYQCRRPKRGRFNPWVKKIPWSRKWQPTPVFLLGKFYGQRSWAGYSSQGCEESDMTEWVSTHTLRQASLGSLEPGAHSAICPLEVCLPFIIFVLPHCMSALGLSLTLWAVL